MCRMIFAAGQFKVEWLIDDIIQLASDNNEKNEENANKEFKHSDGWGLTYLDGDNLKTFRSVLPIYEDTQIEQFKNLRTPLIILHARYGTKGALTINNIHPFENRNSSNHYVFYHNGTVRDKLTIDPEFKLIGETDSEKFFYYLISGNFNELNISWLQNKLFDLKDFSGANFILTNGKHSYIANWYSLNPLYYTMKILKQKDSVIIASEVLPHYRSANWQRLKNKEILSIVLSVKSSFFLQKNFNWEYLSYPGISLKCLK